MLKHHTAVDITYNKSVGGSGELRRSEVSDRTIIPTSIPSCNIKALDVTDLTEREISQLETQVAEYAAYQAAVVNTIFSFEDWLDHSYGADAEDKVKWRTFNPDCIKER